MSRAVTTAVGVARVGEIRNGGDGETAVDGRRIRQIVVPSTLWSSSTWISEDGAAYQRVFDPFSHAWLWYGPKTCSHEARGGFKVSVGTSVDRTSMTLARAIALAWVDVPGDVGRNWHATQIAEGSLRAQTVGWVQAGTRVAGVAKACALAAAFPASNDVWVPLRYAWFSAAGELEREVDGSSGYRVSQRGWLCSPSGAMTQGSRGPDGRRWAAVKNESHVWLDEAVLRSFTSNPPYPCLIKFALGGEVDADNMEWGACRRRVVPQGIAEVEHLAVRGQSAAEICNGLHISRSTLWTRMQHAARLLPRHALFWVSRLVPSTLRRCVARGLEAGHGAMTLCEMARNDEQFGPACKEMHRRDLHQLVLVAVELVIRSRMEPIRGTSVIPPKHLSRADRSSEKNGEVV